MVWAFFWYVFTSVIIAVVINEPEKTRLIEITTGSELIAPHSLHWEVGNALSAMLKRGRLTLKEAAKAVLEYDKIPVRFVDIDLSEGLKVASKFNIYAYDAYFLIAAVRHHSPILSLDKGLMASAKKHHIRVLEV